MASEMTVSASDLRRLAASLLTAATVDPDEAAMVAESLVDANLCGHPSHGVIRIPDYVEQLQTGELRSGAALDVLSETASLLVADAHFGFGQVQCRRLIEQLAPKARSQGLSCGTLKNCGHVGRLGEWVERIAALRLAGMMTVNDNGVLVCVAPPGGKEARISTNPLAIGVPTGGEPMALDFSTSVVANGKVKVQLVSGQPCPPGWLLDADGNPTTNPAVRFSEPNGTLLPMGGEQGYKGFGLGLMLDFLAGGLSGGHCPPAPAGLAVTNNVLMVMWDPEKFAGLKHFQTEADKLIDAVRTVPKREGAGEIRLPGDRGGVLRKSRENDGVPLDPGTWNALGKVAKSLGVEFPAA